MRCGGLAGLARQDIPESIRWSVLRTVVRGWVTTRRLSQISSPFVFGCGDVEGDCVEHYMYCDVVLPMARRHLRLDLIAVRGRGIFGALGYFGVGPNRGFHIALHVDAVLVAHNRLRHEHDGSACEAYAGRLKENSRRHSAFAGVVRLCAAERQRSARTQGEHARSVQCSFLVVATGPRRCLGLRARCSKSVLGVGMPCWRASLQIPKGILQRHAMERDDYVVKRRSRLGLMHAWCGVVLGCALCSGSGGFLG